MKRSYALELIANQLDFLKGTFEGVRTTNFTEQELSNAEVILTTLEHAGIIQPPFVEDGGTHVDMMMGESFPTGNYEWEPEIVPEQDNCCGRGCHENG